MLKPEKVSFEDAEPETLPALSVCVKHQNSELVLRQSTIAAVLLVLHDFSHGNGGFVRDIVRAMKKRAKNVLAFLYDSDVFSKESISSAVNLAVGVRYPVRFSLTTLTSSRSIEITWVPSAAAELRAFLSGFVPAAHESKESLSIIEKRVKEIFMRRPQGEKEVPVVTISIANTSGTWFYAPDWKERITKEEVSFTASEMESHVSLAPFAPFFMTLGTSQQRYLDQKDGNPLTSTATAATDDKVVDACPPKKNFLSAWFVIVCWHLASLFYPFFPLSTSSLPTAGRITWTTMRLLCVHDCS